MRGRALPSISTRIATLPGRPQTVGRALPSTSTAVTSRRGALEIAGNALPSNSMPVQSLLEKVTTAKDVIRGVRKLFGDRPFVWLHGKKATPAEIIARYEEHLASMERVRQARIAYDVALDAERRLRRPMQGLTLAVKAAVLGELGGGVFPEFGWPKPKKPGPKTVKAKLAGVEKRAAKRRKS